MTLTCFFKEKTCDILYSYITFLMTITKQGTVNDGNNRQLWMAMWALH